jgi:ethanolamine ammonia-lyase large subunit
VRRCSNGQIPHTFRGILHIIGERPGTVHHAYSVYITVAKGEVWAGKRVDHVITKLVSNIADTALPPREAARVWALARLNSQYATRR